MARFTESSPPRLASEGPPAWLFDVRIDAALLTGVLRFVTECIHSGSRTTLLYVNVHCLNLARADSRYRDILNRAQVVYCDGTGVRLAAWLTGQKLPERMTGADWIWDLASLCVVQSFSLYLLGGEDGLADAAAITLLQRHPRLRIAGCGTGYGLDPASVRRVNAARPDIVLIGLGSPKQEKWIAAHRDQIDAPVVWAVGALFGFVSGRIPRGPRWLTEHGFEWLCRLATEPRKLWRRYLIGNPQFFWCLLVQRGSRTKDPGKR